MRNPVASSEMPPDRLEQLIMIVVAVACLALTCYSVMNLTEFMQKYQPMPWGPRGVFVSAVLDLQPGQTFRPQIPKNFC
jgi:hypothetical protein